MKVRKWLSLVMVMGAIGTGVVSADTKSWDFAITIDYIFNDTIPCDSLRAAGSGDTINYKIDYATEVDSAETTWHGIYVRIWAKKMTNTEPVVPENAGSTESPYSDTFYSVYDQLRGAFSIDSPYPTYININLPIENLRDTSGLPFNFDLNDSLFFYVEDRYGRFSRDDTLNPGRCQWLLLDTAYAEDPGSADQHWRNENDTLNPYYPTFYGYYYLEYHPDTCVSSEINEKPLIPAKPTLVGNTPNPFNAATDIEFILPQSDHVKLEVTDVLGKRVKLLCDRDMPEGHHKIRWDGTDEKGNEVPSGVYFYKLTVGKNFVDKKKMTLIK